MTLLRLPQLRVNEKWMDKLDKLTYMRIRHLFELGKKKTREQQQLEARLRMHMMNRYNRWLELNEFNDDNWEPSS